MKKHKKLSLRKAKNTSIFRATSFNKYNNGKYNLTEFQNNYEEVLRNKSQFIPDRYIIWMKLV